jgi:hypothetical protein
MLGFVDYVEIEFDGRLVRDYEKSEDDCISSTLMRERTHYPTLALEPSPLISTTPINRSDIAGIVDA